MSFIYKATVVFGFLFWFLEGFANGGGGGGNSKNISDAIIS